MQTLDRTVLEALVNGREHAQASTVTVEVHEVEDDCLIRMVDDGVGYDPADVEGHTCHPAWRSCRNASCSPEDGAASRAARRRHHCQVLDTTRRVVPRAGCIVIGRVEDGQSPG